jgi:hypothetical protein
MTLSDILTLHFSLHGSIVLLSGLLGGLPFARAIRHSRGEVAWRVVHAGGCMGGTMLLAIGWTVRLVVLPDALKVLLAGAQIVGTYLLVIGMFLAAISGERGIPGGGNAINRVVALLYAAGTVLSILGGTLLVVGLVRALW